MNILGIDYGLKRVGLALAINKTIVPLDTLDNNDLLYERIKKIIIQKKIKKIIVGNPILLSGKKGKSSKFVSYFIKRLKKEIPNVSVAIFDERFTSKIATEKLSYLKTVKQKGKVDQISALTILQSIV